MMLLEVTLVTLFLLLFRMLLNPEFFLADILLVRDFLDRPSLGIDPFVLRDIGLADP